MHTSACVLIAFNRRNVSFMGYAAAVAVYVWVDLCVSLVLSVGPQMKSVHK